MTDRPRIHILVGEGRLPEPVREALAALGDLEFPASPNPLAPDPEATSLVVVCEAAREQAAPLARRLFEQTDVLTLLLHESSDSIPPGLGVFDDVAPIDDPAEVARRAASLLEFREARRRMREYGLTPDELRAELVRYGLAPGLVVDSGLKPPGRVSVGDLVDVDALNRQQMSICRLMGTAFGTFRHADKPLGLTGRDGEEFAPIGSLSPYCAYLSAQGGRCLKAEYSAARRALLSGEPVESTCSGHVEIYSAPICLGFSETVYPLLAVSVAVGGVPPEKDVPEVSDRYGVNREILTQMAQESRFWVLNPDKADEIRNTFRNLSETITREVTNKYGTAWQICRTLLTEKEILNSRALLASSNEQLEEKNRQLHAKNEEIYEVTHAITHDLRKPLASLKATLGLVRGGRLGAVPEIQVEAVDTAWEATRYMSDLVDDLLESARLDAGRKVLEVGPVDVGPIVETVRRRLAYVMEDQGIDFAREGEDVTVDGDPGALQKVVMNLVGNAISYIGDDERVIRVETEARDGMGVVTVEDTGVGIPEESLPYVFEKFRRGENVTGVTGTGLGLTIVKGLVEAQGGTVEIESRPGQGTRVTFRLPLATVPAEREMSSLG